MNFSLKNLWVFFGVCLLAGTCLHIITDALGIPFGLRFLIAIALGFFLGDCRIKELEQDKDQ